MSSTAASIFSTTSMSVKRSARVSTSTPSLPISTEEMTLRERLILAQAVYEYGAKQTTWPEIAKLLSKHPLISRPKNFFTAQSCVMMYERLMNEAGIEP